MGPTEPKEHKEVIVLYIQYVGNLHSLGNKVSRYNDNLYLPKPE